MNKQLFSKIKSLVPEPLKRIWIAIGLILASPIILLILVVTILFGDSTPIHFLMIKLSNWTDESKKEILEDIKVEKYNDLIQNIEANWSRKELTVAIELSKKESNIQKFQEVRDEFLSVLEKNGYEIVTCKEEFNEK